MPSLRGDVEMRHVPLAGSIPPIMSGQMVSDKSQPDQTTQFLRSSLMHNNGSLLVRDNHESTWCLLLVDLMFIGFAIQVSHSVTKSLEHAVLLDRPETVYYAIVIHLMM